ncbi:mucin-5AC [Pygocentrus nattereri]|uniref:mucin-5AC n=1 Tax=Pygocentrus nattereri TaxID=42514 RepID=UPI001891F325|nr:mucin-5AC [Pygocentrus nattereri]
MDWRIILAVLCLIEGCALQNTNTTSPSLSPPTSDNGTQSSPSPTSGNGTQPTPSPTSGNGTQPTSPPGNGTQPSPSPTSGNGTQPTSPPGNGTQPTSSPPGNGTQPTPSPGNGTQPTSSPPGNGTQPTPSGNGTSPTIASLRPPFFPMSFSSPETFTSDLGNKTSAGFKKRADIVKRALEFYLNKLPNFLQLDVVGFRNGSVITDTEAVFKANATLPDPANITSTLKDAASNGSLGFNITAGSINVSAAVISTPASPVDATSNVTTASASNATTAAASNATTAAASNATTAAASNATTAAASNATTAAASNATTASASNATTATASNATTASPTNATTSISTTAPAVAAKFNVSFSINDTFNSNLTNSNSDQFQAQSKIIISQLQPFFVKAFKNFIRMFIWRFRSGSILVDSTLDFNSSASIPNVAQLRDTLVNAFKSGNLNFTADPNSIVITQILGNSMAPRMAGSLPLLFMSLISLLLSFALHF